MAQYTCPRCLDALGCICPSAPAQSDAPSAEHNIMDFHDTYFAEMHGKYYKTDVQAFAEAYAVLRTAKLQHDNDGLTGAIEYQKEETRKLMRELESLTPSGSEFVNDPEACVAYVKKERRSLHEILKKAIIEKNELSAKVAQLESELAELELSHIAYIERNKVAKDSLEQRALSAEAALAILRNETENLVVHFRACDRRFCGSKEQSRRIALDAKDITCQLCRKKGNLV